MLTQITEALRRGDTAAALAAAQTLATEQPDNPQAQHLLGVALKHSGDLAGARAAIDRAIALRPDEARFQLSRASVSLSERDLAQAEAGMKDALALDPNLLPAYVTLVHTSLAQNRAEDARRYLKLAQRVNEGHPMVVLAEGHVAQLAGDNDRALRCFTAAVNADPEYVLAHVSLGLAFLRQGNHAFAEQALANADRLEPGNPGVLRGLVEALRRQEKLDEALQVMDRYVALRSEDLLARLARGELRLMLQRHAEASDDFGHVLDRHPALPAALQPAVVALMNDGRDQDAVTRVEAALGVQANADMFWALRLGLAAQLGEDVAGVLQRWLAAAPDSATAWENQAVFEESRGNFEAALVSADRALALQPESAASQLIRMRSELGSAPAQALARVDAVLAKAQSAEAQRTALGWRGMVLDKLGRYDEAAAAFREMAQRPLPQVWIPTPMPAEQVPPGEISGTLLWAPCGAAIEPVLMALAAAAPERLLAERNAGTMRDDGFGLERALPGDERAGSAARWTEGVAAAGVAPADAIDWLTQVDPYTFAALRGARWLALVCDPRDAYLNWMVFGSAQGYRFLPRTQSNAKWLALAFESLLAQQQSQPESVRIIAIDEMAAQPEPVARALASGLSLPQSPDVQRLAALPRGQGGILMRFPAGHWRHYREAFAAEFDLLAPVAERLGYPAE